MSFMSFWDKSEIKSRLCEVEWKGIGLDDIQSNDKRDIQDLE